MADCGAAFVFAAAFLASGETAASFWALFTLPGWLLLAKLHGLYDRDNRTLRHLTVDELPSILGWAVTGAAVTIVFLSVTPGGAPPASVVGRAWIVLCAAAVTFRWGGRLLWRRITPRERTLLIGTGPLLNSMRRKLELFSDIHAIVVGELPALETDELSRCVDDGIDRIIVVTDELGNATIAHLVSFCRSNRIKLSVVPPARGHLGVAELNRIADLPVLEYFTWDISRSTLFLKRVIDVCVASVTFVLLSPVFLLAAVAIRLDSRGPILFRQFRAGLDGVPFRVLKFRTMVADAEARLPSLVSLEALAEPMFKLRSDPRVTRVGRVLRQLSIDELPQLINVIRGEMSLVGPRPEQIELVDRYEAEHRFRLSVKPGLTGPMQVNGRGQLTFEERLAVERDYIENLSLRRDLHILTMTIPVVFGRRGAY